MEFADQIKAFTSKVIRLKDSVQTEESTKTALIMPFFQLLGYDVFNPLEFVPEFVADKGTKKGEKVDYAIVIDGVPTILIEAKCAGEKLDKHGSQLFRYFTTTTEAKFAILTNGIEYRFYTDLEYQNLMDEVPFFSLNLTDLKDAQIKELSKFHKSNFDKGKVFAAAEELKYTDQIKKYLQKQMDEPEEDFIIDILNKACGKNRYKSRIEKFSPIFKKSLCQFLDELVDQRLDVARNISKEKIVDVQKDTVEEADQNPVDDKPQRSIVTTPEEWEAFGIIKVLLKDLLPVSKITCKDTLSYFGVLYDSNSWKWICRLDIEGNKKWLILPDENKNPHYFPLDEINDLFNYADKIRLSAERFIEKE